MSRRVSGGVTDGASSQPECVEKSLMERWRKPAAPTRWKCCSSPTLPTWTEGSTQSFRPLMPATVSVSLAAAGVLSEPGAWNPVIRSLSEEVPVQKSTLHQIGAEMRRLERLRRHERWNELQWVLFSLCHWFQTLASIKPSFQCVCYPECNSKDITCKNGLCKPMFWKCDGVNDCGDKTDEQNCGETSDGDVL